MLSDINGTGIVVGNHVVGLSRARPTVGEHDLGHIAQLFESPLLITTYRGMDDPTDTLVNQPLNVPLRFLLPVIGIADHEGVSTLARLPLYALRELGIEGVRDIAYQKCDGLRMTCDQRPSDGGWTITE